MPQIQFEPEHEANGFRFLATRGQIAFLPHRTYVISDTLLEELKGSDIPFQILNPHQSAAETVRRAGNEQREGSEA